MQRFIYFLTIFFVVMRALGHIHADWLWVLSPMWIGIPLVLIMEKIAGAADGPPPIDKPKKSK